MKMRKIVCFTHYFKTEISGKWWNLDIKAFGYNSKSNSQQ